MTTSKPNFKVGDSVICIRGIGTIIEGEKYIVERIFVDSDGYYVCNLISVYNPNGNYTDRFLTELDYNTNKYNI